MSTLSYLWLKTDRSLKHQLMQVSVIKHQHTDSFCQYFEKNAGLNCINACIFMAILACVGVCQTNQILKTSQ